MKKSSKDSVDRQMGKNNDNDDDGKRRKRIEELVYRWNWLLIKGADYTLE